MILKKDYVGQHKNKVAMISGASSGIGKALAIKLLQSGYKVSLAARRDSMIREYIAEILSEEEIKERVLVVKTDVSVEVDCENWVEKTHQHFGRIDVLINNAGISMRSLFDKCNLSVLRRLMDVNFWGSTYCSHYALKYLLENKGSLVGVSSIAGYQSLPGRAAYSASKAAMQALLKTIRIENRKKGLHVLIACPGFTSSNIRSLALNGEGFPQGETPRDENKMMTSFEVAHKILWAIDHKKRSLVLTPIGKITILLGKVFPGLVEDMTYEYMAKEPNSPFK
ncbi:MAG: SDR family oxidoreductase [Bacteroidales bacterium]